MAEKDDDEKRFRAWYGEVAKRVGIDPNPDSHEHHYDYRALYRDREASKDQKAGDHFPSRYKTEGHPRAYLDDGQGRVFDTREARYLTGEPVPRKRLDASEQSPDMPDWDKRKADLATKMAKYLRALRP